MCIKPTIPTPVQYIMTVPELPHPSHTLHFIPAKINKDSITSEFKDALIDETPAGEYNTVYLRGKQLKGKAVKVEILQPCIIQSTEPNEENDSNTTIINNANILKLNSIINYEREGNEERLINEHNKFNEFMNITNLIHSD